MRSNTHLRRSDEKKNRIQRTRRLTRSFYFLYVASTLTSVALFGTHRNDLITLHTHARTNLAFPRSAMTGAWTLRARKFIRKMSRKLSFVSNLCAVCRDSLLGNRSQANSYRAFCTLKTLFWYFPMPMAKSVCRDITTHSV